MTASYELLAFILWIVLVLDEHDHPWTTILAFVVFAASGK